CRGQSEHAHHRARDRHGQPAGPDARARGRDRARGLADRARPRRLHQRPRRRCQRARLIGRERHTGRRHAVGWHAQLQAGADSTAVDVVGWNLASLTVTSANDANFTLGIAATARDTEGNLSTLTTAPETVTVNPLAPTLAPVAETGLEGSPIALDLGAGINGLAGDANALASLVVSAIPVGATLSDGTHSFTAGAGSTAVDVAGWNLASLTVTSANDANFTLGIAATARDAE